MTALGFFLAAVLAVAVQLLGGSAEHQAAAGLCAIAAVLLAGGIS